MDRLDKVTQGGVILGQPGAEFGKLPAAVQQRVVADISANTLLGEARNALLRAGHLFAMEVKPEGGLEPVWIDGDTNVEMATRIEVALRILAGGTA